MAFELYGMLAGSVSPMTGETIKPAYGGDDEAFLKKVVTPIYHVIARVLNLITLGIVVVFILGHLYSKSFNLRPRKQKEAKEENQSIPNGGTMMI